MDTLPLTEQLARILLAFAIGSVIGLERELTSHTAGFRTHALVCVTSALVMIVSVYGFSDVAGEASISIDPSRVAAGVIGGIGFIGAGAIISHRGGVIGLTTAATLWTVAGIGLAAGAGLYFIAIAASIIVMIILEPMKYIEGRFREKANAAPRAAEDTTPETGTGLF